MEYTPFILICICASRLLFVINVLSQYLERRSPLYLDWGDAFYFDQYVLSSISFVLTRRVEIGLETTKPIVADLSPPVSWSKKILFIIHQFWFISRWSSFTWSSNMIPMQLALLSLTFLCIIWPLSMSNDTLWAPGMTSKGVSQIIADPGHLNIVSYSLIELSTGPQTQTTRYVWQFVHTQWSFALTNIGKIWLCQENFLLVWFIKFLVECTDAPSDDTDFVIFLAISDC